MWHTALRDSHYVSLDREAPRTMSSLSSHGWGHGDRLAPMLGEGHTHHNTHQIYTPKFQLSKRGRWNEIPRFAKSVELAPAFGHIFPCTRSINTCSEVSASGVAPYQVGEALKQTWADSSNRLSMDSPVGRLPAVLYPGDPATNIITDEFCRDNANVVCGRATVAMGKHTAQWKATSTVPDKYGEQRKCRAQVFAESHWDTPASALSISGVRNNHHCLNKCVTSPVQFPSSKKSRNTSFSPSTPRHSGQPLVMTGAPSNMGAWGKRGHR